MNQKTKDHLKSGALGFTTVALGAAFGLAVTAGVGFAMLGGAFTALIMAKATTSGRVEPVGSVVGPSHKGVSGFIGGACAFVAAGVLTNNILNTPLPETERTHLTEEFKGACERASVNKTLFGTKKTVITLPKGCTLKK
jgi:hypothetical protein